MDFYKRVEYVCRNIPVGRVATYGQIALLCGKPRGARQVGYSLSHKILDSVPAHRIVNTRGFLSGADAFETPRTQKKLLQAEKIKVSKESFVDLKKYCWNHTYEDALFFRQYFETHGI